MRTGAALLVAASLLFAACGSNEPAAEPEVEQTFGDIGSLGDIRIESGSMTVGTPVPETPPHFHGAPSGEVPAPSPLGSIAISGVELDDNRAVITFSGDGVVNYVGRYVEQAVAFDADTVFDVPGESILQLDLISSPTPLPDATRPVLTGSDGAIATLRTVDTASGVTQAFVGTSSERPDFTVSAQQNPPAIVVEVL